MKIIDTYFNGFFGALAILATSILILAVTTSTTGFVKAKQELSAAKRYYMSQVDNSNTSDIASVKNEVKRHFPGFNFVFFRASPIEVQSEASTDFAGSSQKDPYAGYYGRPLTVRFSREVAFFFNRVPFTISIGSSTVNRAKMVPDSDKSIEYRIGKEYEN